MTFKDYTHIELLEDGISIAASRIKDNKIIKVKDWKPTNPFRLRVKATVRKNGKRTIKKRTYVYEGINMVAALKEAGKELEDLLKSIRKGLKKEAVEVESDKDEMMTFEKAFYRSLESRKEAAEAESETFRSYDSIERFYINHLTALADMDLDQISKDTLNKIRANMKHPDGTPFAKKTKLAVLQHVNPVYTWFNDYSNQSAKSPAKIPKGAIKKLGNNRRVKVDDIAPLFNAMYNYTYKVWGKEYHDPYRSIFIWLMHGRRVNEVLSLDWENVNLKAGTYTIIAENNKAKVDMTYKLTPYQVAALPEKKKSGLVFPSRKTKTKIGTDVLWTHWKRVRVAVGEWTLNNKEATSEDLHIHDIRHLIATEMLNKHKIVDEISGAVLGHTRPGITARYAEMLTESVDEAIMKVLDGVLK
jgi:integrase